MKILVETSARHIHLSASDFEFLFGKNSKLTSKKELSQPGQYVCREKLNIIGPKDIIKNVAILGPFRELTQIEISLTDSRKLGLATPIRDSGDLDHTPGCILVGPRGTLRLHKGVIIARRHIHIDPENALNFNLENHQTVKVKVSSSLRPLIFDDVKVFVNENFRPAFHIDTDEANAAGISSTTYASVL